jgi:membrane protease YdiL (CAAX protease family)
MLLACIATAFVEEFIFRGYIQLRLMDHWGPQIGWLVTAVLCTVWGIIPLLNAPLMTILISAGYRLGLALLLGWIARQSGGIIGGWMYHAAHMLLFWL